MGDALKSQKKGLKLDVTRMGYTRVYTGRKNAESLCVVETVVQKREGLCVAETICETGPVGKWIGKSLRGSNSALHCVPTWTHSEAN